jgi:hypothetical protein
MCRWLALGLMALKRWNLPRKELMTEPGRAENGNMKMEEAYHESFDRNSRKD